MFDTKREVTGSKIDKRGPKISQEDQNKTRRGLDGGFKRFKQEFESCL